MLRIADLLNNIGEDDAQLTTDAAQVKLGRSVSAPERGARADEDHEAAMAMMSMIDDDEHAASCPEDKQSPRFIQTSTRLRSFQNPGEGGDEAVATQRSPYGSQQQFMTITNTVNPGEPTEASGASLDMQTAAVGKKRSMRSLFPELSESDRRAKQRLIVKRCYYKKIELTRCVCPCVNTETIKSLRDEATTLEHQFRSALRTMQQEDEATKAAGRGADETLREENVRLRRLADEYYMKNQGRLRQLLDSNHKGLILFTAAVNDD
ncbi:hypothetical protein GQ600_19776 [Phytophthora cactorum]|nr:hypothetical protein GQ600_19776 [Phytophthora cactorum]